MSFKNKKIAFVFPGQGAQYIGMGMSFINQEPILSEPLRLFDERNETELAEIIKNGPEEKLRETQYTQPAILYHSYVAMKSLQSVINVTPDFVAGHSLGEITALVANGVLKVDDAMQLVHKRGEFMIKANEGTSFAMAAVIGLDSEQLNELCKTVSATDLVVVANYNTPEQTVISGTANGVSKVCDLAKEMGAKRALPLSVGGPFHSPLISKAEGWLRDEINHITFNQTTIPIISNVDAKERTDTEEIKQMLTKQVTSSVLWVDSVRRLVSLGVDIILEFGPKKVLAGMIKKIDRNIEVMSVDVIEDLESVKGKLEQI